MLEFKAPKRGGGEGRWFWVGITQQPSWSWKPVKSAWPLHDFGDKAGGKGEKWTQMEKKDQIGCRIHPPTAPPGAGAPLRFFLIPRWCFGDTPAVSLSTKTLRPTPPLATTRWTICVLSDVTQWETSRGRWHAWVHSDQPPTRAAPAIRVKGVCVGEKSNMSLFTVAGTIFWVWRLWPLFSALRCLYRLIASRNTVAPRFCLYRRLKQLHFSKLWLYCPTYFGRQSFSFSLAGFKFSATILFVEEWTNLQGKHKEKRLLI